MTLVTDTNRTKRSRTTRRTIRSLAITLAAAATATVAMAGLGLGPSVARADPGDTFLPIGSSQLLQSEDLAAIQITLDTQTVVLNRDEDFLVLRRRRQSVVGRPARIWQGDFSYLDRPPPRWRGAVRVHRPGKDSREGEALHQDASRRRHPQLPGHEEQAGLPLRSDRDVWSWFRHRHVGPLVPGRRDQARRRRRCVPQGDELRLHPGERNVGSGRPDHGVGGQGGGLPPRRVRVRGPQPLAVPSLE